MDRIFTNISEIFSKGYRNNAFAPWIWAASVFLVPFITAACIIETTWVRIVLFSLIVLIILFSMVMFVVMFMKDPNMLRSEKYLIEDKKLDMIAEKGGEITFDPVVLTPKELEKEKRQSDE